MTISQSGPNARISDRFVLEYVAGSGGMGTVYRARDEHRGTFVAIKLLQHAGGDEHLERFQRETQVLADLDHPAIVRHVAHGVTEEGEPFLAMEWLEGEELTTRLLRGPLSLSESLTLVRKLASALAFAHARGIVHRDVKPSNVFLRGGSIESPVLLDFGIAQLNASTRSLTATGIVVGTPAYMAPEQARAEKDLGPSADVFSLGCIFFECLTGSPAFSGGNVVAILGKILFSEAPRLRDVRPDIPAAFDELLVRMLARDSYSRLSDGNAVVEALNAIDDHDFVVLANTIPSIPPPLGNVEHVLATVLVASSASSKTDASAELNEAARTSRLLDLVNQLKKFGARAEIMADGSLVAAFVTSRGAATDQAALAARAALLLKSSWPEANIVICTGRSHAHAALPIGEVLERSTSLLHRHPASESSDQILIDDVTRGLLDARFRVRETSSGIFALTSEDSTLDPSRPLLGKPTPCVGRESELGVLDLALTGAIDEASSRAVLVVAPPGTGKSRLRHEFMRRAQHREDPPLVLLGQGDPMTTSSPYGILGQALRRCAGIAEGEDLPDRRAKLVLRVSQSVPSRDVSRIAAFLGEVCGIPFVDDNPKLLAARQDPKIMVDQITTAFIDFLRAECNTSSVVLVLEDLHWGDALTVKLADAALRQLENQPFLILGLARPEVHDVFPKLWDDRAQVVALRPLSRKAGERLVLQVLGNDVAAGVVSRIVQQSEGNALFLEELIRGVAEGHGEEAPRTVLAMLQSRIGRLPAHARRVLRAASIFGETTWYGGMQTAFGATLPQYGLDEALRLLMDVEVLELRRESRFPQEQEYRFRHALMRDAAYGLLADDERIQGHRLAGEYLETMGEQDSLVVAEHFVQGQQPARAWRHFMQAAEQSRDNGDMETALVIAERGLALDPEPLVRGALLAVKADAFVWRERYAEVLTFGLEALGLLEVGSKRWCQLMQQLMPCTALTGRFDLLGDLGRQLVETTPADDAKGYYVAATCWISVSYGIMGQKAACEAFLERAGKIIADLPACERMAAAYYESAQGNYTHLINQMPWPNMVRNATSVVAAKEAGMSRIEVLTSVYHGKALMDLGDVARGETILREAVALAKHLNEAMNFTYGRTYLARLLALHGSTDALAEAYSLAEQILATENQSLAGLAHGVIAQIEQRRGNLVAAGKASAAAVDAVRFFPTYAWDIIALHASILMDLHRAEEALDLSRQWLERLESLGVAGFGEIHLRLAVAEALHATGSPEAACTELRRTLDRLRVHLETIPEAAVREQYMTQVPTNARVLELAERWFGDLPAIRQELGLFGN